MKYADGGFFKKKLLVKFKNEKAPSAETGHSFAHFVGDVQVSGDVRSESERGNSGLSGGLFFHFYDLAVVGVHQLFNSEKAF